MIQRIHPFSKNIAATEYHPEKQELVVTFKPSGTSYRYFGVNQETHANLLEAKAIGSYFAKNIKLIFSFKKIDPITEEQSH